MIGYYIAVILFLIVGSVLVLWFCRHDITSNKK